MKLNALCLAMTVTLWGCGGESGNNKVPVTPIPDPVTEVKTDLGFFATKGVELPVFQDYFFPAEKKCIGFQPLVTAVDMNSDGLKDLVVHMWCGVEPQNVGKPKTEAPPDTLAVFLQTSEGKFEFANEKIFGYKEVKLNAAARNVTVADYNNDGFMDLAYAMHMEDGRETTVSFAVSHAATSVVVLSESKGKYKVEKLGTPDWFHSVESVKNDAGGYDVVFAGNPKQAFRHQNNAWLNVSDQYPYVSPATFAVSDDGKTILTPAAGKPDMIKYQKNNSQWVKVEEGNTQGVQVPFSSWNYSLGNTFAVYQGNNLHVQPVYDESCFLNLTPTQKVFIGKYNTVVVPNYVQGTVVSQTALFDKATSLLHAFNLNNVQTPMPSIIENEETSVTYSYMKCADINNDGYDDIVVNTLWSANNSKVIFYVNNKQGKLVKMDSKILPQPPETMGDTTSIYEDLNNDGVPDLLYFNSNKAPVLFMGKKPVSL